MSAEREVGRGRREPCQARGNTVTAHPFTQVRNHKIGSRDLWGFCGDSLCRPRSPQQPVLPGGRRWTVRGAHEALAIVGR